MPLKNMVLKFVIKTLAACLVCSAAAIVIILIYGGIFYIKNIIFAAIMLAVLFFAVIIALKIHIYYYFRPIANKIHLISERIKNNEDFEALISGISEIDNLMSDINKMLSKDNLDFTPLIYENKGILGVFKIDYDNKKFIFSLGLVDFFKVKDYKQEGNVCVASLGLYYDFNKNIGKSAFGNEDNLYYEDTPNGRRWFNIFLDNENNFGYGFIVDATKRIISDDFNKIRIGKNSLSKKFYSADVMIELLRNNIKNGDVKKACLISAELTPIKLINERYGYDAGSAYIKLSENLIFEAFKNSVIGKKSLFEYYIFMNISENENPTVAIQNIFDKIYDSKVYTAPDGKSFDIKFNVGFSVFPDDTDSLEILFKYSAYAIYEAKKLYNTSVNSFSLKNYNNEAYMDLKVYKLDSLIRNNELYYVYQPIVSLIDGSVFAYEALMRPNDKIFLSPREVIELVLNKNLSYKFEKLTVYNCLDTVNKNRHIFKNKRLLYNTLGTNTLKDEDIADMHDKYDDIGHILVPEIEETENDTAVMKKCISVHETGDKFAIDNFTGKSENFENIFRIKPTYVKIDRSLITDIGLKPKSRAFLANLVRIAKKHEVSLIALGVETSSELKELIKLGVDFAQGYYIAKPQKTFCEKIDDDIIDEIVRYTGNKR